MEVGGLVLYGTICGKSKINFVFLGLECGVDKLRGVEKHVDTGINKCFFKI
jgi:hypothetical protein